MSYDAWKLATPPEYDECSDPCSCCGNPIDGYSPTAKDPKLAPADGLCEQCHTADVNRAKRDRADAIRESHGDYLRDQQKGA